MKLKNKKVLATYIVAAISCSVSSGNAVAEEKSFVDSIKDGKATLGFRFRIEDVDREGTEGATATTLKTRLNYASGAYKGVSGFVEFDQVSELIEVDYNTGPGGATFAGKAAVFDPEGTDLNQAYMQYVASGNTIKYGRQRILLDDQRFVGGVGWRQNEQTYDATSYGGKFGDITLFGAYVMNVNRIFGDDRAAGDHHNSSYLLNANYKFGDAGSLTGYAYLLDNKNAAAASSSTYGVRFTGAKAGFGYTAEYATQSDAADNIKEYTASFLALEGSYALNPVKFTLGYQNLGADGSNGYFVTPLATLHKFQGWTDMFLNGGLGNIAGGIQDTYGSVGGTFGPITTSLVYHQFAADDSAAAGNIDDYGSEWGIVVGGKAGPVGLTAKYADYSADGFGADTSLLWLMATLSF